MSVMSVFSGLYRLYSYCFGLGLDAMALALGYETLAFKPWPMVLMVLALLTSVEIPVV